jgi:crotonobetainyl-CoA:carnitine CoA-transferase CaiB-like acyl-CoA transferase
MNGQTNAPGALTGVKIVDLSRVLAGPYATQILGDHGADVIKIEPPAGDETREWGPPFRDDGATRGPSAYYLNINRNKRGIVLDLSKALAREVLLKLLEDADILIENFKLGTMEKWGIGPDALRDLFPRLVYARITGFGAEGPYGGYPGYDAVVQTMAGLSSVNGSAASGPVKMGTPIVDMTTGLNAVIGVLMALRERDRTGRGQYVEVALYDAALSILHPHTANYLYGGKLPSLTGNAHPNLAPYDLFQTATRPVFLGVGNDRQFKVACNVLDRADISADARFANVAGRNANRAALTEALALAFANLDGVAIASALLEAGVPAGTLNNVAEVLADPHTQARGMVVRDGTYHGVFTPVKLSDTPAGLRRPPPDFGADTRSVLSEAGYSEAEIDALIAEKAAV